MKRIIQLVAINGSDDTPPTLFALGEDGCIHYLADPRNGARSEDWGYIASPYDYVGDDVSTGDE